MKRILYISLAFIFTSIILGSLWAGPTIIKDNRITDLATTPALGRGYSIATNTFQSICLRNIKLTKPSYDFTYTFKELEATTEQSLQSVVDMNSLNDDFREEFVTKISNTTKTTIIDNRVYYNHNMMAIINLHSYYASVDESGSKMSSSASHLLRTNDLPGFFSSCGSYYVRSIGRKAKFIAIFTYRERTKERNLKFEQEIITQIKGFGTNLLENGENASSETKEVTNQNIEKLRINLDFSRKCTSKRLTITAAAFGLGKNEKATLISYDTKTFRAAIKDAFLSMQDPRTGKVVTIEVVPWVENTDFQSLIKLEEDTVVVDKSTKEKKKLLLYEKKQILNQNAEFLAELERLDRNLLNLYYKAKICKDHIQFNWKNGALLKQVYAKRKVLNNRGGKSILLSKLDSELSDDRIDRLFQLERNFMYGGGGWGKGAAACMKEMLRTGMFRISYRDIANCTGLIKKMTNIEDELIDKYCMPVLITEID